MVTNFCWLTLFSHPFPIFPTEISYLEVVAPPISKGIFIANLSISLATKIISSKEGVMRPDRPIISIANLQTNIHKRFSKSTLERHRNYYYRKRFFHTSDSFTHQIENSEIKSRIVASLEARFDLIRK